MASSFSTISDVAAGKYSNSNTFNGEPDFIPPTKGSKRRGSIAAKNAYDAKKQLKDFASSATNAEQENDIFSEKHDKIKVNNDTKASNNFVNYSLKSSAVANIGVVRKDPPMTIYQNKEARPKRISQFAAALFKPN